MSWYYIQGILTQSCYTLMVVLGLSVLTGYTGLFSFGHAGFVCIGAYVSVICTMGLGLPYGVALLIAGLSSMLIGALLGRITLKLKGDYFCIATLGVGEAVRLIFNNVRIDTVMNGKNFVLDGAKGISNVPLKTSFGVALLIVTVTVTATAFLLNSRHGRSMLAIREDELAAQMAGINTFRYKMLAMCMSTLYAGIAGGMLAHYIGYLQPNMFQMVKSTEYTIMVIFGGMGSITGSVLGTVLLCSLPEALRAIGDWRLVLYGLAVIIIMILRPKGLMGGRELRVDLLFKWLAGLFSGKRKEAAS